MRQRRKEASKDTDNSSSGMLPLSSHHARQSVKTRQTLILLLAVLTFCLVYLGHQWRNQKGLDLNVFLSCRQIDSNYSSSLPCVYFRPTRYFFQSDEPGFDYRQMIQTANVKWTMWGKFVSTFYNEHSQMGPSPPSRNLQKQGIESVSVILIPKVASRSMEALFQERLSVSVVDRMQFHLKGPRIGIASSPYWKVLAERQASSLRNNDKDIVISILRDPVSRFLSSLAQTLSTPMMNKCKACSEFWNACLETSENYKDLIKCALQRMKRRPVTPYFDVHVMPQAFFLGGVLEHHDVEVAVFEFQHVEKILNAFGMSQQQQHVNTRNQKEFSNDILEKFETQLLDPQEAYSVLDKSMIQDVCELYEIDVVLLHHLGFSAGDCDYK